MIGRRSNVGQSATTPSWVSDEQAANRAVKHPTWKQEGELERALKCALLLQVKGLISDGERLKIHRRMLKRYGGAQSPMADAL